MNVDITDIISEVYELVKIQSVDGVTADEYGIPTPFVLPQFNQNVAIVDLENSYMGSFGGSYTTEKIYEMYIPYSVLSEHMLEGAFVARSNGEVLMVKGAPVSKPYGSHAVFTLVSLTPQNEPGRGTEGFPDDVGPGAPAIPPRCCINSKTWAETEVDFSSWLKAMETNW
jgi:hypothetical protein